MNMASFVSSLIGLALILTSTYMLGGVWWAVLAMGIWLMVGQTVNAMLEMAS